MVSTPFRDAGRSDAIRDVLETSYRQRQLLHIGAGSAVPLLKNTIWLVVRGMVKLEAVTIHGDPLLLGLAGPNEPFGEPLTNVQAYEAFTLTDSDLLCLSCAEIEQAPHLAMAVMQAVISRHRQTETLLSLLGLRRVFGNRAGIHLVIWTKTIHVNPPVLLQLFGKF